MDKFDNNIQLSDTPPYFVQAFILLALALFGFLIVGPVLGFLLGMPFYDGDMLNFGEALTDPVNDPSIKIPMFIMQGCATFTGMILVPWIYLNLKERQKPEIFFQGQISFIPIFLAVIITISFMSVNSIFIEWNQGISFPDFMSGFEEWARDTEKRAAGLTESLTTFDSNYQFIIAFFIVAVLAGVAEEFLFRGFLQNQFYKGSKNIHIAIWLSAFLFSAIHMQFFGFIPRMLLGALFGYLYYWSGNLSVPILAHVTNNGFTLIMMYLHQTGVIDFDMENSEASPLSAVLIFTIITAGLIFIFRRHFLNKKVLNG